MTSKRIRFLKELFDFVGLTGRLRLEWISSAEAQKFVDVMTDFTEQIKALGPNPLRQFAREFSNKGPNRSSCQLGGPTPETAPAL